MRLLGADHPTTLRARANLAVTYSALGRHHHALALEEAVRTDYERLLGPDHPDTLRARANLAFTYRALGRHHDADLLRGDKPYGQRRARLRNSSPYGRGRMSGAVGRAGATPAPTATSPACLCTTSSRYGVPVYRDVIRLDDPLLIKWRRGRPAVWSSDTGVQ
ncbi:tetratricopeptide repeat protein [Streptomyces goshikiensis]|uniref:tetratricopeptide repeat protein n=1 Tax=Streptomyces goshikiensis TaxID=1942 RepID=UPI0036FFD7F4